MKKPKIHKKAAEAIKRPFKRRPKAEERVIEALSDVPRITNETVAEHREEVLGSARKYIYPLQHSKRRIVAISAWLLVAAVVVFLVYTSLALYKFQSTDGFIYDVTRVVPFPVAKADKSWVSYESYLFELRRVLHYYETQQKGQVNFATSSGKQALTHYKQQAMDRVVADAYVKKLAVEHHVKVSDKEVDAEIVILKQQNRLGSSDKMFATVLQEFWGWSINDFKRELKQELLQQKVVATLDTATNSRATAALKQLQAGADFATVAGQVSDDPATKANGGQYAGLVNPNDGDIPPQVSNELFKLQPGQVSGVIDAGYTLEIVKVLDKQGNKVHAAHIQFDYQDISTYTKPLQDKSPAHHYIKV